MIINPGAGGKGVSNLPGGGTVGQVLTKKSAADNDAEWKDVPGVPSGVICMWSGAANAIPDGWMLCNGSNGTPDLRNRFIVGAGNSYDVGATGGSNTVTLEKDQMPEHYHTTMGGVNNGTDHIAPVMQWVQNVNRMQTDTVGGSQPHENRPPYYALCFIMKQ